MKNALVSVLILLFTATIDCQTYSPGSVRPKDGFVPNSETAVKIAEAVLIPVYGEKHILKERPFIATRKGDVWMVGGTIHCDPPDAQCYGGAAVVKISKSTGEVLEMVHYK